MKRFLLIPLLLALVGCSQPVNDNWTMFYYSDRNDREFYTKLSGLADLESCQDFGVYIGTENGIVGLVDGTYECGKNCKRDNSLGMFVCEETVTNQ